MEITRAAEALQTTINTVEGDLEEILKSGEYYCTEEISRELNAIRNGLEHLRLDSDLLTSDDWQKSFNPRNTAASLSGATSILDRASARLFDYKAQLKAVNIGQKQENEEREAHQWAITTLQQIQKDLEPYTYGANSRIRQFGDHVGVTDRYLGYRNNLTRGPRAPSTLESYWMDRGGKTGFLNPLGNSCAGLGCEDWKCGRPPLLKSGWGSVPEESIGSLGKQVRFSDEREPMTIFRGYRTIDSLYPRSNTYTPPGVRAGGRPNRSEHVDNLRFMNCLNATLATNGRPGNAANGNACGNGNGCINGAASESGQNVPGRYQLSVQERAGINTDFPGQSEYMLRYTPPADITRVSDFLVNPRPDMAIHGRPLAQPRYTAKATEYHTRYQWPDGNRILSRPWAMVD